MPRQSAAAAVAVIPAASAVAVVQDAGLQGVGEVPRQSAVAVLLGLLVSLEVGEVPRPSEEEGVRSLLLRRLGLVEDAGVLHQSAEADAKNKAQPLNGSLIIDWFGRYSIS